MNFNQLEYFVNAAETLNFTKAAKQCFISQTAMTQQIKALEETVGVPLFVRDKHHVELTNAGKIYLNEARAILKKNSDALRLVRTASEGIEGNLTIGFIRGYGGEELSGIIRYFHTTYPNITLNFVRDNMSLLIQKLEKGECDMIFTIAPRWSEVTGMNELYIKSLPVMAVMQESSPLAQKEYLTYPELKDETFILMQPAGRPRDEMEETMLIYERGGFMPQVAALEGDPETLLLMISAGLGISYLPEYITRSFAKRDDLAIRPMVKEDGAAETIDMVALWPESNYNPATLQMVEVIKGGL